MSPQQKNTRSSAPLVTPDTMLMEAMNLSKATKGVVKDVNEAKKYLVKEGWTVQGEAVSDETLARVLLSHALLPKMPHETVNILTTVAYLITSNLQQGVA